MSVVHPGTFIGPDAEGRLYKTKKLIGRGTSAEALTGGRFSSTDICAVILILIFFEKMDYPVLSFRDFDFD